MRVGDAHAVRVWREGAVLCGLVRIGLVLVPRVCFARSVPLLRGRALRLLHSFSVEPVRLVRG